MNTYRRLSDSELFARIKSDDQLAYIELFERYKGVLHIHIYRKIGSFEDASDILQDLFASVWALRGSIPASVHVSGYLYRAVRNKVIDHLMHRKIRQRYLTHFEKWSQHAHDETDATVRFNELKHQIESSIEALPPKMRQVFRLSRVDHLSHQQIAEVLSLSEYTVKNHIKGALKILRRKMGPIRYSLFMIKYF